MKDPRNIFEQVAQNGYTGEILYNRFQVLSSITNRKKYEIVDHEMPDGIHREKQDEHNRRELFDAVEEAEARCRELALLPVPKWAKKRGSLRDALCLEIGQRKGGAVESTPRRELVDRVPDRTDPALYDIYTGLLAGQETSQIMTMLYTRYPDTSYKYNFVNWYKNQLHLMGKLPERISPAAAVQQDWDIDDLLGDAPTKKAQSVVKTKLDTTNETLAVLRRVEQAPLAKKSVVTLKKSRI